jgi:hypothetical protein
MPSVLTVYTPVPRDAMVCAPRLREVISHFPSALHARYPSKTPIQSPLISATTRSGPPITGTTQTSLRDCPLSRRNAMRVPSGDQTGEYLRFGPEVSRSELGRPDELYIHVRRALVRTGPGKSHLFAVGGKRRPTLVAWLGREWDHLPGDWLRRLPSGEPPGGNSGQERHQGRAGSPEGLPRQPAAPRHRRFGRGRGRLLQGGFPAFPPGVQFGFQRVDRTQLLMESSLSTSRCMGPPHSSASSRSSGRPASAAWKAYAASAARLSSANSDVPAYQAEKSAVIGNTSSSM